MNGIWILFILMLSPTLCGSFSSEKHHTVILKLSSGGRTFHKKIHSSGGRILPLFLTYRAQSIGDEHVKPATLRLPVRYGPQKYSDADFNSLQRRIRVLECLVGELCGALLHSDDMSMLERNTAEIGKVYRDATFVEAREPAFARTRIERVLQEHGFTIQTQPHHWVKLVNESFATNATNTSNIASRDV